MSFGQELKDFASGFGGGARLGAMANDAEYKKGLLKHYERADKRADLASTGGFDYSAAWDDEANGPQKDDPGYEPIDSNEGHSALYNAGKWIKQKLGFGAVPTSPTDQVERAGSMPLEAYNSVNGDTPDDEMLAGYAQGGIVSRVPILPGAVPDDEEEAAPTDSTPARFTDAQGAGRGASDSDPRVRAGSRDYFQHQYDAERAVNDKEKASRQLSRDMDRAAPEITSMPATPYKAPTSMPAQLYIPPSVAAEREVRPTPRPAPPVTQAGNTGAVPDDGPITHSATASEMGTPDEEGTRTVAAATDEQGNPVASAAGPGLDEEGNPLNRDALHGGLMAIQRQYGLDQNQQGVTDPQEMQRGQHAAMNDRGPDPKDIESAVSAVDPDGRLGHAQALLRVMNKAYEFYMARGDATRAENSAAMIIQYANHEAALYGKQAVQALRDGDAESAAQNMTSASQNFMGGRSAQVTAGPNGTFKVTEINDETGKPINEHSLSGDQLYAMAMGTANKSLVWQGLMEAASQRKGGQQSLNATDIDAISGVYGQSAEGVPTGQTPQGQPQQGQSQGQGQPQPQGNGQLISRADPNAMHFVESNNNPNAVSPKGAVGIGQTMPNTLRDPGFGVAPAKDNSPQEQQRVADQYLQALSQKYGNPVLAHIAYNWGPGNMESWIAKGAHYNQLPAETQQYLSRIAVAQGAPQGQGQASRQGAQAVAVNDVSPAATPRPSAGGGGGDNPFSVGQAINPEDMPPETPTRREVEQPQWSNAAPRAGMSKMGVTQLQAANRSMNTEKQRQFRADQDQANKDYQGAIAEYKNKMAALKSNLGKEPNDAARTSAMNFISDQFAPKPETAEGKAMAQMQPTGQRAVSDMVFGIASRNPGFPPNRLYSAALTLVTPPDKSGRPAFTVHQTANPEVNRVRFSTGETVLMPRSILHEAAAAMGNEHFVTRKKGEEAALRDFQDKKLDNDRRKAVKDLTRPAKNIEDYGTITLN